MNQKALYEQLITEKLEQLPVPDMADQIWARIESQLDLDLPTDGGDEPVPDVPPGGGSIWSQSLLFVTILAVLSLFTIPQKNIQNPAPVLPAINTEVPTSIVAPPPDDNPTTGGGTTREDAPPAAFNPQPDTSLVASPVVPVPDTGRNAVMQAPPPATGPAADSIPKKRPRGVQGIGDADYRIVPKKDSGKGN